MSLGFDEIYAVRGCFRGTRWVLNLKGSRIAYVCGNIVRVYLLLDDGLEAGVSCVDYFVKSICYVVCSTSCS